MGLQNDTSIDKLFERYADRPALRQCSGVGITDTSFRELWGRASALAAALGETVRAGDRIAVLGAVSADLVTLDLASWILGAVSVPLQVSASVDTLHAIVDETVPVWIAATSEQLATAVTVAETSGEGVRTILLDAGADADADVTLDQLVARGVGLPRLSLWHPAPGEDPWRCCSTRPAAQAPQRARCTRAPWSSGCGMRSSPTLP